MSPTPGGSPAHDNLALLYQGLLTNIVRVRSGSHPISNCEEFQKRIRDVLSGVVREAVRVGYPEKEVLDTKYAIVAFLDEAVLDSNDPSRHSWTSLLEKEYGQAVAGERFFDQIEDLRRKRDSPQLADILEVYYLCLLLGYLGRYGGYARERLGELRQMMDDLRARIEGVRGASLRLSVPAPKQEGAPRIESARNGLRTGAIVSVAGVILIWVIFRLSLTWMASGVRAEIPY